MVPSHGPEDPALWITRKLGYWEDQIFGELDHTANCSIVLNTCISAEYMDPEKVEEAYRALIYNQPNFRAAVRRGDDGGKYFYPATDFSDVFEFIDQSGDTSGVTGYAGCWDLAEELCDIPFSYESAKPLHKCYLVKRPDCYILLTRNCHGIGDGTTSFRVLREVVRQYDLLVSGKELDLAPVNVLPSLEEMSRNVQNDKVVKQLIDRRIERAKDQKVLFPMNLEELAASRSSIPWINKNLHALGTPEGFQKMRARSKELGVTVGSYSFAVMFLAEAAVYIQRQGGEFPESGVPMIYTDVVANLRTRLDTNPEDKVEDSFMLCIGETDVRAKIEKDTTLYDLARDVRKQLESCYEEKTLVFFDRVKAGFEGTEECSKLQEGTICGFLPSNKAVYSNPTKFSWGEIKAIHSLGSYCPFFANQVLLFHKVDKAMCYSVVCCDGENNLKDTQEVFDLFVAGMEHADKLDDKTAVMDFVKGF